MNDTHHITAVLVLSLVLSVFIGSGIFFIPSARHFVGTLLISYDTDSVPTSSLSANVLSAVTKISSSSPTNSSSSSVGSFSLTSPIGDSTNTSDATPDVTLPSKYEYRLLRSVDICQLNTLGAQGFKAIQFGGNIDTSSGRSEDCKNFHTVDVLDWVLFEREK